MNIAASEMGPVVNPFALPYVNLDDKTDLPSNPGLYFVIDGKTLLYIGRSKDLNQRWKSHHRYKQIKAISKNPQIAFLDVDDEDLLWVERDVINRFNPLLNDTRVENNSSPKLTEEQMRRLEELKAKQQQSTPRGEKQMANRFSNPEYFAKLDREAQLKEASKAQQKVLELAHLMSHTQLRELKQMIVKVLEEQEEAHFESIARDLITATDGNPQKLQRILVKVTEILNIQPETPTDDDGADTPQAEKKTVALSIAA